MKSKMMDSIFMLCFTIPLISGLVFPPSTPYLPEKCSVGQVYWCKNITTAVECRALKHCIKGVWEKEVPIEKDVSTVCQTCIEMVKEARDQLNSNETETEIREVLEGTCKVIPTKVLRHDCDKLMDDFGSYIVDTLSSEMNPQVVCSVAGLCNNAAFRQSAKLTPELNCDSCQGLMKKIEGKVETASEGDIRTAFLGMCRNAGTYSDACSMLVLTHLPQIGSFLSENVKAAPVCSLAGVCTAKYHSHASVVRVDAGGDSDVEVITTDKDDLPCDLCEQLVKHLKDVLVANTTEEEFKQVLIGLCGQMQSYKNECTQMVNNYYPAIYSFLTDELNGKVLCQQIGICPASEQLLRPLLPVDIGGFEGLAENRQLPIERLNPFTFLPKSLVGGSRAQNQVVCSFCEYFLHFIQQEITLPSSERKIRDFIEKGCSRLPSSVIGECNSFVETYIDAFVALLANKIDPSQVCPGLGVCAGELILVEYKDKPTCPLCLLAMEEAKRKYHLESEEDINDALDDLCIRDVFPNSLSVECAGFITAYRDQLTDMILANFTSEEVCLYSKVCVLPNTVSPRKSAGSIETNEIHEDHEHDNNGNNRAQPNTCVLCEFVMTKLEKILKDKTTEEEIKDAVFKVCNYLPKTVTTQCKNFIEEYADLIIELITNEVSPKELCTELNLCETKAIQPIRRVVRKCLTCEVLMESLKAVITDADVESDFNENLKSACRRLPQREIRMCISVITELAPQIEAAVGSLPIGPLICRRVGLCGAPHCALGPVHWCESRVNAIICQETDFCEKNIWNKNKELESKQHSSGHLKGTDVI